MTTVLYDCMELNFRIKMIVPTIQIHVRTNDNSDDATIASSQNPAANQVVNVTVSDQTFPYGAG